MKKYYLYIVLTFVLNLNLFAQIEFGLNWAKTFETNTTSSISANIDNDGNLFMHGAFAGQVDADPSNGTYYLPKEISDPSHYIVNLNNNGQFKSAYEFEIGVGILFHGEVQNGTYIAGNFNGEVNLNPFNRNDKTKGVGRSEAFLQRIDDKNVLWKQYTQGTGNAQTYTTSFCGSKNGEFYWIGKFMGVVGFDMDSSKTYLQSDGSGWDIFIMQLDSNGHMNWLKQISGEMVDGIGAVGNNGNLTILGKFSGDKIDANPGIGKYEITPQNDWDIFYVQLNGKGKFEFAGHITGPSYEMWNDIKIASDGSIYMAGVYDGKTDFNPSPTETYYLNKDTISGYSGFILKLDSLGKFLWAKRTVLKGVGEVKRICLDQQNNVYSYGVFLNEPTFVSKGKNVSFKAKGSLDVFLQKFGSNGYEDFVYVFGSSGVDQGSSINWINGELLATGTYTGTIDFDPSNKKFNKTSSGTRSEAFVLSLKCNQNIESLGDSIADLKIECGVLNNYTPFLSDECGNAYTPENTINFPLKINADTVINWQYNLNGKTVIQSQKIVLADTTAPLISIDTLAPIYSYCELNKSDLSIPQAQDNCAGIIDAVTQMEFPMSVDTTIIWQFTDNYGNVSLQYQRVIITDTVKPVPMIEHLDTFFASCQFNTNMSIKAPEAYDSCAGIIKGVKQFEFGLNDFSIKKIIWTYTDNHGNSLTQIQPIKWQSINTKVENRDPELWVESALVSRQWLDCNNDYNIIEGANDRAYTPKTNGSYAVELTFQLCVDTSDCYQILNASVNNKNSTELTIYPNPASDILNIKLNSIEFEQGLNLDFFTPNGQNVKSLILNKQTIAKGAISINVAEFSKGLYFLKLSSSKGVVSKKIIVE